MKYFIHSGRKAIKVSEERFNEWDKTFDQLPQVLPPYCKQIGGITYFLEADFLGALEDFDQDLPYVLISFEDYAEEVYGKAKSEESAVDEEHFATFTELNDRYLELIDQIEAKA